MPRLIHSRNKYLTTPLPDSVHSYNSPWMVAPISALFILAVIFIGIQGHAAEAPSLADSLIIEKLDNGLYVMIQPADSSPFVRMNLTFNISDARDKEGLTHLLEHLLFSSSHAYPEGGIAEQLYLQSSDYNGLTYPGRMVLTVRCLPNFLPNLMALDIERLTHLSPSPQDMSREKQRICDEMVYRDRLTPRQELDREVLRLAFQGEPLGRSLIGSREQLESYTLADVNQLHKEQLTPERAILQIIGPVDPDSILSTVRTLHGSLSRGQYQELPIPADISPTRTDTVRIDRQDLEGFLVTLGFRIAGNSLTKQGLLFCLTGILKREGLAFDYELYSDYAILLVHLFGEYGPRNHHGRLFRSVKSSVQNVINAFWESTEKVLNISRVDWLVAQRRDKMLAVLMEDFADPEYSLDWAAKQLLLGRDITDITVLSELIAELSPDSIQSFMSQVLVRDKSFIGVAHGGDISGNQPIDQIIPNLSYNAYIDMTLPLTGLSSAEIQSVLGVMSEAAPYSVHLSTLNNGAPVHYVRSPDFSDFWLGGIESFPFLKQEQRDRKPGFMHINSIFANAGYGVKGSYIPPIGHSLTSNLSIFAAPYELHLLAHGTTSRFKTIGQAMAKRLKLDCLNPYVCSFIEENEEISFFAPARNPHIQAMLWRLAALFGDNHPILSTIAGDPLNIPSCDLGEMKRLHRNLCKKSHFTFFALGNISADILENSLNISLGELKYDRSEQPSIHLETALTGVVGETFDDTNCDQAMVALTFVAQRYCGEKGPTPFGLRVIESAVESRLRASLAHTGPHRVRLFIFGLKVTDNYVPGVWATCSPDSTSELLLSLHSGLETLQNDPLTSEELWRACLRQTRTLYSEYSSVDYMLDLLSNYARCGDIPRLAADWTLIQDDVRLTQQAADFFSTDCYAYTTVSPPDMPKQKPLK